MLSYSSVGHKSDMGLTGLKSRCQQGCIPSESSREKSPCLAQLLEAAHIPWLMAPSSIFKASNIAAL